MCAERKDAGVKKDNLGEHTGKLRATVYVYAKVQNKCCFRRKMTSCNM
jgi:hypothetical protein